VEKKDGREVERRDEEEAQKSIETKREREVKLFFVFFFGAGEKVNNQNHVVMFSMLAEFPRVALLTHTMTDDARRSE
jgi:hypothetical protein